MNKGETIGQVASILISLASQNAIFVLFKASLLFLRLENEWLRLLMHILLSSYSQTMHESVSLCVILLSLQGPLPAPNNFYTKSFLQLILILLASGLFTSDVQFLILPLLCLSVNLHSSEILNKLEHSKEYCTRIKEENKLYASKLEVLQKKSASRAMPIRRSSSLLNKLKSLRAANLGKCFTEVSDNDSSRSDTVNPEFSSRKSSINVEEQDSVHKSNSFIIPENLLPGISNEEIKEIINTLITQEYLMWNPQKCGENEVDVIAVALESKKMYTQSIENLPGSSHRTLKLPKARRLKSIRSMIEVSDQLGEVLESIGEWDFDCFELIKETKDPAFEVGLYIFNTLGLSDSFQIEHLTLRKFLTSVEHTYNRNNFYHNSIHAADVTASTLFLIQKGLSRCGNLVDLDVFALVTAALCHDIAHPGVNNAFLVATGHELAMKYNDHSCLENMHTNKTFTILNTEGSMITSSLNVADYQRFRKSVVGAILSTDLQMHFDKLNEFRVNLDKKLDISDDKFRGLAIQMCLKCADIGHGARKLNIHVKWTSLISKEFFKQGEMESEHGLPVSPLCDRTNSIISKSQIGFLEVLVRPLFIVWEEFIEQNNEEDSELEVKVCMQNINENIEFWSKEFTLYQQGTPNFHLDNNPPPLLN